MALVVAAVGVLAGLAAAGVGALLLIPAVRFAVAATASADGTVVGHDRDEGEEDVHYYPRVAFTAEGREWVVRGRIGHGRPQPPIGARVRVYFPPGDPQAAEFGRAGGVWAAAGLVAVGVGLVAGAVRELVRG